MGTLSNLIEFQPFNMQPPGSFGNPMTEQNFRVAQTYANPEHFAFWSTFGPFTPAALDNLSKAEYIAQRPAVFSNNAQIVTIPERPVDSGTFQAIVQNNNLQYVQPDRGVYLQNAPTGSTQAISGSAPNTAIYTGITPNPATVSSSGGRFVNEV